MVQRRSTEYSSSSEAHLATDGQVTRAQVFEEPVRVEGENFPPPMSRTTLGSLGTLGTIGVLCPAPSTLQDQRAGISTSWN